MDPRYLTQAFVADHRGWTRRQVASAIARGVIEAETDAFGLVRVLREAYLAEFVHPAAAPAGESQAEDAALREEGRDPLK